MTDETPEDILNTFGAALVPVLEWFAPTVAADVWEAVAAVRYDGDINAYRDALLAATTPILNAASAELRAAEARFENENCWTDRIKH
jgi:hypothetical protein